MVPIYVPGWTWGATAAPGLTVTSARAKTLFSTATGDAFVNTLLVTAGDLPTAVRPSEALDLRYSRDSD